MYILRPPLKENDVSAFKGFSKTVFLVEWTSDSHFAGSSDISASLAHVLRFRLRAKAKEIRA